MLTAFPLHVAPPQLPVSSMNCRIYVLPTYLCYDVGTPHGHSPPYSQLCLTVPRTTPQTLGPPVTIHNRTRLTPGCIPPPMAESLPTGAMPPVPCLCSGVLQAINF